MAITHPPGGSSGGRGRPKIHDDEESADAREVLAAAGRVVRPRALLGSRRRQIVVFFIIVAALVILLLKGLGNAAVYFKTADEAVVQRASIGTHRFRLEGTVQTDVHAVGQDVAFTVANNGATLPVVYRGAPPQLFKPGIPVVLEGHFQGDHFASDRIMVKHTADYVAKHPQRVNPSDTSVPAPSPSATP